MSFSNFVSAKYSKHSATKLALVTIVICLSLIITTLSIMNGFERELRQKILAIVPHIELRFNNAEENTTAVKQQLSALPELKQISPFVEQSAILIHQKNSAGSVIYGIDAAIEQNNTFLLRALDQQIFINLQNHKNGIAVSQYLAKLLKINLGDNVLAITNDRTGRGISIKLEVVYIYYSGTELDQKVSFSNRQYLQTIRGESVDSADGLRIYIDDPFQAYFSAFELNNFTKNKYTIHTWRNNYGSLYTSISVSKMMVSILVFIICAIAGFNLMSTMIILTAEKELDIAIFSTFGVSRKALLRCFVQLTNKIALKGCLYGSLLGIGLASFLPILTKLLQNWFGLQLLTLEIYPIDYIPSQIQLPQIIGLNILALITCYLSALYPAFKASKTRAVELLNTDI